MFATIYSCLLFMIVTMVTMVTGKLQVLKYLIVDVGADPVARDNDGLTTLHAATQGGHLDVVRVSLLIIIYNALHTVIHAYIYDYIVCVCIHAYILCDYIVSMCV